ncbi:MAG: DUF2061 domain-containing protein [Candidatus Fonsibacter sp.]
MAEFDSGFFNAIKKQLIGSSIARAIVYTIGHIIIAATCNVLITGSSLELAAVDAIIEPLINGVWYYLLDKFWASKINNA